MSRDRNGGRRADRNAFRPALEDRLESRIVLAAKPLGPGTVALSLGQNWGPAYVTGASGQVGVQVARGGRSVNIADVDGELYRLNVTNEAIIKATPTRDGRVDLLITGSKFDTDLVINHSAHPYSATNAHQFPAGATGADGILHIRNITVRNGSLRSILGYGTAELSGTLKVRNPRNPSMTTTVDRIALFSTTGAARIEVAATINTIDILTSASFSGANAGIYTVGDLNALNTVNDLSLSNGATLTIGRDLGAVPQLAKGTGKAGVGANIGANLSLSSGARINVVRNYDAPITVQGNVIINGNTVAFGPVAFQSNIFAP